METKARTKTSSLKEEGSPPLRGILCVKTRQDMKRIEETEDCFILDFNPFDSFDVKRLSYSLDKDLEIIHETGQVACRDYPHPRHLCLNFPFGSTSNATHCDLCYCYVCDKPAPCALWMSSHCNASEDSMCYCYVCDKPAPCAEWTISTSHCNAYDSTSWNLCRTK